MSKIEPFDVLLNLEKRCQQNALRLPAAGEAGDKWVGVGFRVGGDKLIAAMSEVEEILDVPEYTKVPGVKSWVVGIANVRGELAAYHGSQGLCFGH